MHSFTVKFNPHRIHFQNNDFKRVTKERKDFKGRYKCEVERCPAQAEIDKKACISMIPGFEKHHNHHLSFPVPVPKAKYYNHVRYTVCEKPYRVIADGEKYISDKTVNPPKEVGSSVCGFYRCEILDCPVRAHIDNVGIFRYLDAGEYGYCPIHKNHPPQESYLFGFSVTQKPLRLHLQDHKFVKKGKIGDNYNGVFRCEDKKCPYHVRVIGSNVHYNLFSRNFNRPCTKGHSRHSDNKKANEKSGIMDLYYRTLDRNRFTKSELNKISGK